MNIIFLAEKVNCSCIFLEFPALGITPLKFWNLREGGDREHRITMRLEVMAFPGDEKDCDFQISCPAWNMLDMLSWAFQIVAKFTDPRLFASFIFSPILKEVLSWVQENLYRRMHSTKKFFMSCTYYTKG